MGRAGRSVPPYLEPEHSGTAGRAQRESRTVIKAGHTFRGHEPDKAPGPGMLIQVAQNGLHKKQAQSFSLKFGPHNDVLKIEIQPVIADHPTASEDIAFVPGTDGEQGVGQALPAICRSSRPADCFSQREIFLDHRDSLDNVKIVVPDDLASLPTASSAQRRLR